MYSQFGITKMIAKVGFRNINPIVKHLKVGVEEQRCPVIGSNSFFFFFWWLF